MQNFSSLAEYTKYQLFQHRILQLFSEVNEDLAGELVSNLILLSLQDSFLPIKILINSPGGTVSNGLMPILDCIQQLSCPVETLCCGEACSSAAIILATGTKGLRKAYPNSTIMIHGLSTEDISGTPSQVEKESKRMAKENKRLMEITAELTGKPIRRIKRDCKTDKYMTAKEALDYGLIDQIIQKEK